YGWFDFGCVRCVAVGRRTVDQGWRRPMQHAGIEAITHAVHGMDVLPLRRTAAERLPQQRDRPMQDTLGNVPMAPYRIEDVVVGQGLAGMAGQQRQHGERLRLERDVLALDGEAAAIDVDFDVVEGDRARFIRQHHESVPPPTLPAAAAVMLADSVAGCPARGKTGAGQAAKAIPQVFLRNPRATSRFPSSISAPVWRD